VESVRVHRAKGRTQASRTAGALRMSHCDLVPDMGIRCALQFSASLRAFVSIRSFKTVDVPCRLT